MATPTQLALDFESPPRPLDIVPKRHVPHPMEFEVLHSPRRRTLGLEVHRDLRVVIRAPLACPDEVVARYVARHRRWITRQLANFEKLPLPRPAPQFVDGEFHLYRGKAYRLTLRPQQGSKVYLSDDALVVGGLAAADPRTVESALTRWYATHAKLEFPLALARCMTHPRFAQTMPPHLRIRAMRSRWGSLCRERGMTLNTVLIQAPPECLDYVIFHELCHLSYRGHGPRFYRLLSAVLPDWEARKQLLEATITW